MKVEGAQCLIINAPEWFRDPVFVNYLNNLLVHAINGTDRPIATWHQGGEPGEYSDTFIVYDNYEGSDIFQEPGLEHIWDAICLEANRAKMTYGVIWIKNIQESEA